jgi:hypothetical protein
MAAGSRKAQDLKAKEAKQKKILIVAMVLFFGLMAIQVPKLMHRTGNVAAAPPVPVPTAAPVAGAPATPSTLAPPGVGAATGTAVPAAAAAPTSGLADTDVVPVPGQLIQFDLFASKDPFIQQVKAVGAGGAPAAASASPTASAGPTAATPTPTTPVPTGIGIGGTPSGSSGGSSSGSGTGSSSAFPPGTPTTAVAELTINGTPEQVLAGRDFPAAAPAFRLVTFTSSSAKISVAGGTFQTGAPTITLAKGKSVTLMNTADGSRYVLVFRAGKTVATSSLPPAPVAPTPATTAPALPTTAPTTTAATTTTPSAG